VIVASLLAIFVQTRLIVSHVSIQLNFWLTELVYLVPSHVQHVRSQLQIVHLVIAHQPNLIILTIIAMLVAQQATIKIIRHISAVYAILLASLVQLQVMHHVSLVSQAIFHSFQIAL
jgi:hypothetical protein